MIVVVEHVDAGAWRESLVDTDAVAVVLIELVAAQPIRVRGRHDAAGARVRVRRVRDDDVALVRAVETHGLPPDAGIEPAVEDSAARAERRVAALRHRPGNSQ